MLKGRTGGIGPDQGLGDVQAPLEARQGKVGLPVAEERIADAVVEDRRVALPARIDGLPPGELRAVPEEERGAIVGAVRAAQAQHYRNIAAMSRDEKIRAGAYVYFSFLRPFAEIAGVADELDWTVPRDIPEPLYELLSAMQGENAGVPPEDEAYYERYPDEGA